jgi:hypothetical protein
LARDVVLFSARAVVLFARDAVLFAARDVVLFARDAVLFAARDVVLFARAGVLFARAGAARDAVLRADAAEEVRREDDRLRPLALRSDAGTSSLMTAFTSGAIWRSSSDCIFSSSRR